MQMTMNYHVGSRNQSPDPPSILVPSENHFQMLAFWMEFYLFVFFTFKDGLSYVSLS